MFKLLADYLTYDLFKMQKGTQLADSINFFLYDLPKIYFMLLAIVFFVAILRSYLPPDKIKKIVSGKGEIVGNFLMAVFGIFMPFCTCSAIPLFLGMIESGIPLGVAMSFIISSPTINEVAVVLLWGLFGWKVAGLYIFSGLVIATLAGFFIGRLKMEKYVEKMAYDRSLAGNGENDKLTIKQRVKTAYEYTIDLFKYIWIYVFIGIAIGSVIHGYIPGDILTQYAGKDNPFAVIIAVLIGVPLYANCAGAIPVAQALMDKGLPLGTSLAFLMAVTGLSLPEFFILRRVMKLPLLLTFFGIVALGIVLIGYMFNFVF